MTQPLVFALPGNEAGAAALADALPGDLAELEFRHFPDRETYLRVRAEVRGRRTILVCTLADPDPKFLPLLFASAALYDLGATEVGLVTPYLAYMRQDKRFSDGEAVTSGYFATALSAAVDWLVTVDPHLHRHKDLSEIYSIPARAVHAGPALARWIAGNVPRPLLVGPDVESEQWVSAVAGQLDAPFVVLEKTRHGDRDVSISLPDIAAWQDHKPVVIDDIISTGRTMVETVLLLRKRGLPPPVCAGIHGIFAEQADVALQRAGAGTIVTTNTITDATAGGLPRAGGFARIDIFGEIAAAIASGR